MLIYIGLSQVEGELALRFYINPLITGLGERGSIRLA